MTNKAELHTVKVSAVLAWPNLNPRRDFNKEGLDELAASIKDKGLLNPVSVAPAGLKKDGVTYWLYAGERRLRACKLAGVKTMDVLVRDVDEATAHHLAGIENLDRDDLTSIEEATWLHRELELTGQTQKELGETLGRSQAWIANRLRLLALPKPIQTTIHNGTVAPAMARDVLLRFLKLDASKPTTKFWKELATEIKARAKIASPVILAGLQEATSRALRTAGFDVIRDGYHHRSGHGFGFNLAEGRFAEFKKEHAGQCVQSGDTWQGETVWTSAVFHWTALLAEEEEAAKAKQSRGGMSKERLAAPKLGPARKPVDYSKLRDKFGRDNVILFSQIVDPSKIKPTSVTPVNVPGHLSSTGEDGVELAYVGPNAVRTMKGNRTRRANPIREAVSAKVQAARLKKATGSKPGDIFAGLLDLAAQTHQCATLEGLLSAELGRDVELHRYGSKVVSNLKLTQGALRRVGAALALIGDTDSWKLEGEIDKAVEKQVTKDTEEGRAEWIKKHVPPRKNRTTRTKKAAK